MTASSGSDVGTVRGQIQSASDDLDTVVQKVQGIRDDLKTAHSRFQDPSDGSVVKDVDTINSGFVAADNQAEALASAITQLKSQIQGYAGGGL